MDFYEKLSTEHAELNQAFDSFLIKEMNSVELKHTSAPFGIYEQSNGKFMVRVRLIGGQLTVEQAEMLGKVVREKVGYLHLTTRQNVQLQDVDAAQVCSLVSELNSAGFIFRGGGGNTFRSIAADWTDSTVSDSGFSVLPYAYRLNAFMMNYDPAFKLPRKLKIAFSASESDESLAKLNDLGFVANIKEGKKCFSVYGGGGMGRSSAQGIKLLDNLGEDQLLRCAKAMTDLFYDHGDRSNRNKARIRFLVKRIGESEFRSLFHSYFDKTELDDELWRQTISSGVPILSYNPEEFEAAGESRRAVSLHPPQGNIQPSEWESFVAVVKKAGLRLVRISRRQELFLPFVAEACELELTKTLSELNSAWLSESAAGRVTTCIGATVCRIGILDSQKIGGEIADAIDEAFSDCGGSSSLMVEVLESIRVSGCPNSCGAHPAFTFGFQGMRRKVDGQMIDICKIHFGSRASEHSLLLKNEDITLPCSELPSLVYKTVKEFIEKNREDSTFRFANMVLSRPE